MRDLKNVKKSEEIKMGIMLKQVTGHNIVADGWAGVSDLQPHPNPTPNPHPTNLPIQTYIVTAAL